MGTEDIKDVFSISRLVWFSYFVPYSVKLHISGISLKSSGRPGSPMNVLFGAKREPCSGEIFIPSEYWEQILTEVDHVFLLQICSHLFVWQTVSHFGQEAAE